MSPLDLLHWLLHHLFSIRTLLSFLIEDVNMVEIVVVIQEEARKVVVAQVMVEDPVNVTIEATKIINLIVVG